MNVLILFATVEGQTQKIADFAAGIAADLGHAVTQVNASDRMAEVSFEGQDGVILAAPVHERRHPEGFEVVLQAQADDLAKRQVMMISVSLGAAFPELIGEAQEYLIEMKMRTGLQPQAEVLAAGAIRPASYGYYETQVLRHAILANQPIDPATQEHEFTDWEALEADLRRFLGA